MRNVSKRSLGIIAISSGRDSWGLHLSCSLAFDLSFPLHLPVLRLHLHVGIIVIQYTEYVRSTYMELARLIYPPAHYPVVNVNEYALDKIPEPF